MLPLLFGAHDTHFQSVSTCCKLLPRGCQFAQLSGCAFLLKVRFVFRPKFPMLKYQDLTHVRHLVVDQLKLDYLAY